MNPNMYSSISAAIKASRLFLLQNGEVVKTDKWQGVDAPDAFFEALNWTFTAFLPPLSYLKDEIKPNVEWADAQFLERVGGAPLNPGESYKLWPAYLKNPNNDKFRPKDGKFSHTYMERFWPKDAGDIIYKEKANEGVRFIFGDFSDLISLLIKDPHTRQAYLPIWFPEDTGAVHGERVPCTIGYWFVLRKNKLHITYHIRACDYFRHFRDDIYLAAKLVYYIISEIKFQERGSMTLPSESRVWEEVGPGTITMNIGSFHIFNKELQLLKDETYKRAD